MKVYAFAVVMILILGFVVANGYNTQIDLSGYGVNQSIDADIDVKKVEVDSDGRAKVEVEVETSDGGKYKYETERKADGSIEAKGDVRLADGTRIREVRKLNASDIRAGDKINLSNGRIFEIKIMPETASARALARLNLTVCPVETCRIELKEVGKDNDTKVIYEVKTEQRKKVFGLFRARMKVQADVDAVNGTVIAVKNPWWAVFASNDDSEDTTPTNTTNTSA